MMRHSCVLFLFLFCVVFIENGWAHEGTVTISGTIQDNTCELSPDSQSKIVNMGRISRESFSGIGDKSSAKAFSIKLEDCGPAASEAIVTFSGTPNSLNSKLFSVGGLFGNDSAGGVALGLYDSSDKLIAPEIASSGFALEPGQASVEMKFFARYISVESTVTPGAASAMVSFLINYN